MLDQHYNSTAAVVGKWVNTTVDGAQLKGDSEFDLDDPKAALLAGKVDRGYIKGASMGVTFNRDYMKQQPDGSWQLTQCELFEVSIVAVPSNRSSLTLFAETGEILSEDQVKLSIAQLTTDLTIQDINKNDEMEKFNLSAAALLAVGLANADNSEAVSAAIVSLSAQLSEEKAAHTVTKQLMTDQVKLQATALIESAILAGKITADEKEEMITSAIQNLAFTTKMIDKLPAKTTLSGEVKNTVALGVKTMDDFEKLDQKAQLAFKAENPDAYKALFS